MSFQKPFIILLVPLAAALIFYAGKRAHIPGIQFSSGAFFKTLGSTFRAALARYMVFLRIGAVCLIMLSLARPQVPTEEARIETEGINIVLAVDSSTSMLAEDFTLRDRRVNRLEAVKDVVRRFIEGRPNDKIGLVTFAGRSYTVCPPTLDHQWLMTNLERVEIGMIEDGTAVGSGIASSLNRLKDAEAKERVIILLTDGINNAGKISPMTAAEAAKTLGVKIYTIGAGTKGLAPYPVRDMFGNVVYQPIKIEIDEDTLKKIARVTEGEYFRATDTRSLEEIYGDIDKLEKTKMRGAAYTEYKELFAVFLIPGLILLLLEIFLADTFLRRIP